MPNDHILELSRGIRQKYPNKPLFHHILIDDVRDSNLNGETHSRNSFTTNHKRPII